MKRKFGVQNRIFGPYQKFMMEFFAKIVKD